MTFRRPKHKARSLSDLGRLMKDRKTASQSNDTVTPERPPSASTGPSNSPPDAASQNSNSGPSEEKDENLFAKAMADVTPLRHDNYWQPPHKTTQGKGTAGLLKPDEPEIEALNRLIREGKGFQVADTPEYMESAAPDVDRNLVRRLHQGRFAVQGHLDLHGLTSKDAQHELTHFIHDALVSGKRMVLVIHGRGLTSPGEPVLKKMVYAWLTRGPYRRHILAFTSARSCDGGAGATYVLLRKQPWIKKKRSAT